jgi:hypothetical protein
MSPQPTGRPGIASIQEPTHVTPVLAFTLNHGTLEDVDATVVNMFDTGNGGEEHVDGRDPFLGEARLKRQGDSVSISSIQMGITYQVQRLRFQVQCLCFHVSLSHRPRQNRYQLRWHCHRFHTELVKLGQVVKKGVAKSNGQCPSRNCHWYNH